MQRDALLDRARHRGVNPLVYWIVRAVLQPFFHVYWRLSRLGREHIPQSGPVIFAANHRSFLDPFVIAVMARRPIYFVAKKELFEDRPFRGWFLNSLGAFPIDRGMSDEEAMGTARTILERGDAVLIFPEGTRNRPGGLGRAKRGVGRLALETGAPVVPVAVRGTDHIREGWKVRPHKISIRAGRPLTFPRVEDPSPQLAQAVTERIWPCVQLQWEWLGGAPALRRAVVVGAGTWGTGVAVALSRAGLEVELGCRTGEQVRAIAGMGGVNGRYLPGHALPDGLRVVAAPELDVAGADLVVLAVPARHLPVALATHGDLIRAGASVVVLARGLVGPEGELPAEHVARRLPAARVACVAGPSDPADALAQGAAVVVAGTEAGLPRELCDLLRGAGLDARASTDLVGTALASVATTVSALAASAAEGEGPGAAGAAAGRVFEEVVTLATRRGAKAASFTGVAGVGDVVRVVLAHGSRDRRAGELLGAGRDPAALPDELGSAAEGLATLAALPAVMREAGVRAPAVEALAAVAAGQVDAGAWARSVTRPGPVPVKRAA